ncbi:MULTISPECIES: short chain dehydrogenase [Streptomyces]|uniref:Short chain dehydrogenase n=1 Tax=Streptomyces katrae TaxID=68223 RepID=A0ABT7H322_9ACTN|nr:MULTISPECIES: short chain dehydrogenase [Streptomyces]MDK9499876.1 short chain dehydrogenase [Streptomyces katrae]GLX18040.1 short chain dehydrogenase [Streptomyces lavendulae subsp. lavendulae]GLX26384.1 short chain dehydrogenase [Streptomyces lavendulae subsp. lavendulae]
MNAPLKVLLVGANGTLGSAVRTALRERGHEVVTASRKDADVYVDITDPESIRAMYDAVGPVDAVASAAGSVPWRPLSELSTADVREGLEGKAVSQVELVRQGAPRLPAHASFTLVTGILAREPLLTGSVASLANGAVEAFVRAAAIELPGRQRVNAVSPTVFTESLDAYGDAFAGFDPVPVARAANAYVKSVEGHRTGEVFRVE